MKFTIVFHITFLLLSILTICEDSKSIEKNASIELAPKITIQIPKSITLSTHQPLLTRDVLEFREAPSSPLWKGQDSDWLNCTVLPLRKEESTSSFTSFEFLQILKTSFSNCNIDDSQWVLILPQWIQIRYVPYLTITNIGVKNLILTEMKRKCNDCEFEIISLKIPNFAENIDRFDRESNQGKKLTAPMSYHLDFSNVKTAGSLLVPIKIISETKTENSNSYWISGFVKAYKKVPISQRKLLAGQILENDDFSFKQKDITYLKDKIPTSDELLSHKLSRNIEFGSPIYYSDLKKEFAAQKGQVIQIISATESIEIRSNAIASESGFIGDRIKLKVIESNKELMGQIIEKGVVKIE